MINLAFLQLLLVHLDLRLLPLFSLKHFGIDDLEDEFWNTDKIEPLTVAVWLDLFIDVQHLVKRKCVEILLLVVDDAIHRVKQLFRLFDKALVEAEASKIVGDDFYVDVLHLLSAFADIVSVFIEGEGVVSLPLVLLFELSITETTVTSVAILVVAVAVATIVVLGHFVKHVCHDCMFDHSVRGLCCQPRLEITEIVIKVRFSSSPSFTFLIRLSSFTLWRPTTTKTAIFIKLVKKALNGSRISVHTVSILPILLIILPLSLIIFACDRLGPIIIWQGIPLSLCGIVLLDSCAFIPTFSSASEYVTTIVEMTHCFN